MRPMQNAFVFLCFFAPLREIKKISVNQPNLRHLRALSKIDFQHFSYLCLFKLFGQGTHEGIPDPAQQTVVHLCHSS